MVAVVKQPTEESERSSSKKNIFPKKKVISIYFNFKTKEMSEDQVVKGATGWGTLPTSTSTTQKLSPVKGVVDLTFLDIKDEVALASNLDDKIQKANYTITVGNLAAAITLSPDGKRRKQPEIKAIRLSNNLISDTSIIVNPITRAFDTTKVMWLDLSFNHISSIGESLGVHFPNITTLYLQANQISKLSEVKKLGQLTKLKSLALYGNPLEENKHYKNFVLYTCQNVSYFDNSTVTKMDRQKIDIFGQTYRKKLRPEEYE